MVAFPPHMTFLFANKSMTHIGQQQRKLQQQQQQQHIIITKQIIVIVVINKAAPAQYTNLQSIPLDFLSFLRFMW